MANFTFYPNFHLAHYHGDEVIADTSVDPINKYTHKGIDIQVKAGTPIYAPRSGIVNYCTRSYSTSLGNGKFEYLRGEDESLIIIKDTKTNLFYIFGHVSFASIPDSLKVEPSESQKETYVNQGDFLGCVFKWPYDKLPCIKIPRYIERVYGRSFDHLEFSIIYRLRPTTLSIFSELDHIKLNPLLLLKKLKI